MFLSPQKITTNSGISNIRNARLDQCNTLLVWLDQ